MKIRILVVDDHEVVRQGICSILQSRSEWQVCGEAADGRQAVKLARELDPDAIVMDVTMPIMGGLNAAHEILQSNPRTKVLIFTMHDSKTLGKLVQRSGAQGFVVKSEAAMHLIDALDTILAG